MKRPAIDTELLPAGLRVQHLPDDPAVMNAIPLKFGTYYICQTVGLSVAPHVHDEASAHYVLVIEGAFRLYREGRPDVVLHSADMAWCAAGVMHSIICESVGRFVNARMPGGLQ